MSMLRQRTIIVNNYYNNINGTKISEKLSDHWSRSVGVDTVWPLSLQLCYKLSTFSRTIFFQPKHNIEEKNAYFIS